MRYVQVLALVGAFGCSASGGRPPMEAGASRGDGGAPVDLGVAVDVGVPIDLGVAVDVGAPVDLGTPVEVGTSADVDQPVADSGMAVDAGVTDGPRPLAPACFQAGTTTAMLCDLVVEASGLEAWEGRRVAIRTGGPPPTAQRMGTVETRIVGGRFSVTLPAVQENGFVYKLTVVHVDVDGDDTCSTGDQMYSVAGVAFTYPDGGAPTCLGRVSITTAQAGIWRAVTPALCPQVASLCGADGGA